MMREGTRTQKVGALLLVGLLLALLIGGCNVVKANADAAHEARQAEIKAEMEERKADQEERAQALREDAEELEAKMAAEGPQQYGPAEPVDAPDVDAPDFEIPGSQCVGKGIFRVCS